jgi:hypothetical protein
MVPGGRGFETRKPGFKDAGDIQPIKERTKRKGQRMTCTGIKMLRNPAQIQKILKRSEIEKEKLAA